MEDSDEVGSDEVDELFALTQTLEEAIGNFSFTGSRVSGGVESGFIVEDVE
jgi:hypothetical protein